MPNQKLVYTLDQLRQLIIPLLKQYGMKGASIFGSYARGTPSEESDIDLLVDSPLRGLDFIGLIESIRESLADKEVDVIDISEIDSNSPIDKEIQTTGVELYAR